MGELFDDPPFTVMPDPAALLAALGALLSDDDLAIIAEADHGWRAEESHAALLAMARDGVVPRPLPFYPLEPLELTRWDEPPVEPAGERRLLRHAFACCALLRAYGDAETCGHMLDQNPTLAGLAISLHRLSTLDVPPGARESMVAMERRAAALLAWLLPRVAEFVEADFFALTLLWFSLAAGATSSGLEALIAWIMTVEEYSFDFDKTLYGRDDAPRVWLLGRRDSDLRHHTWRELGALLPGRLRPEHGPAVAEGVRRIARLIAGTADRMS